MKKILSFEPKQALNIAHRKENQFSDNYVLFDLNQKDTSGRPCAVVDLRIYYTAGKTCYACAWINFRYTDLKGANAAGSSRATGYGYDKKEQASRDALTMAGFKFDTQHQELQPEDALALIAEWFGLENSFVHHSHA